MIFIIQQIHIILFKIIDMLNTLIELPPALGNRSLII